MLMSAITLLALSPALIPSTPTPSGEVIVVDAAGAGDYMIIQAAVNAAIEGDVILVRGGSYSGFTVDGMGLTVIGDNVQPRPQITGKVALENLPDGQTLVLSGFDVAGGGGANSNGTALRILGCLGAVRIQDSELAGRDGFFAAPYPGNAINIGSCANVALTNLTVEGGSAYSPSTSGFGSYAEGGGTGVHIQSSKIVVQRCIVSGGEGGSWTNDGNAGDGGTGLLAASQVELVLVHALISGGAGGDSGDGIGPFCAVGGNALEIGNFQCDARGQSLSLVPGEGGTHVFFGNTCSPGSPLVGPMTIWNGNARSMITPSLVRAGEQVLTTAHGQPGDLVWRWVSTSSHWERRATWHGTLLIQPSSPNLAQLLGSVPGDGSLEIDDSWRLPNGMEGLTIHTQALFCSSTGRRSLSNTTAITVLDPAF